MHNGKDNQKLALDARLSRSVWIARSLLSLLCAAANPSASKAPASRAHSKRFAKCGRGGIHVSSLPHMGRPLPLHFCPDKANWKNSPLCGETVGQSFVCLGF